MIKRPPSQLFESPAAPGIGGVSTSHECEPVRSSEDWAKSLGLIESVAETSDQTQAIVAIATFIARQFPDGQVGCGIGSTRLRRYYDPRLGWLAPASDLFLQASENWESDAASLPTRPSLPSAGLAPHPPPIRESIRLNIDDDVSMNRCVLWIHGGTLSDSDRIWLVRTLPSLRAMVWQRGGGWLAHIKRELSAKGMTTRVYLGLATLFVVLLLIWPVSYRVRCNTLVRPKLSRIVAAPFEATLEATHVKPGDSVKVGDVLISLDGRPLRLELESVQAQIGQVAKERDIAMVGGRVAESQQAKLRIRELTRQRDLLADRLNRLQVTSPIEGVVVFGDLTRSIGAPLETGQAVLEVAPLDDMVVELEIPEYEIGYVDTGTQARIRLTATGGAPIEAAINAIYPSAELRDDQNVFIAQIDVQNSEGKLRPGMRGDAIAYGPLRPWLWSFVRSGWEKTLWWIGY